MIKTLGWIVGIVALLGLATFLLSYRQSPTPNSESGVIVGQVLLGPTCPVERIPPDPACAPRGYETTVRAYGASNTLVAELKTGASGNFQFSLAPGAYTLQAQDGATLPRCTPQSVTVSAGATTTADISCDTGIR